MKNKKLNIAAIIIIILVVALGSIVWIFAKRIIVAKPDVNIAQNELETQPTMQVKKSGWQTYVNNDYGFEFNYPEEWKLSFTSIYSALNIYFTTERGVDYFSVYDSINDKRFTDLNVKNIEDLLNITTQGDKTKYSPIVFGENISGYEKYYYNPMTEKIVLDIYAENNERIYTFRFPKSKNQEDLSENEKIFLSTFKFIN